MTHDVFISYSSRDKLVADAICAKLEEAKLRCWIAPRDILPGMEWGEGIIEGINRSRLMVLVFSSSANASPQIRREVERAVHKSLPIIPFRIEEIFPSRSLEYFLSSPHWLDALTPPVEKHIGRLVQSVRAMLEKLDDLGKTVVVDSPPTGKIKRVVNSVLGKRPKAVQTLAVEGLTTSPRGAWPEGVPPPRSRPVAVLIAICALLALALLGLLLTKPSRPARVAAAPAPTAAPPPLPTATAAPPPEPLAAASNEPAPSSGRKKSSAPPAVAATFECRRGVKFSIDPDKAIVTLDGRQIGIASDYYHRAYNFVHSGTHYAKLSLRGYRTEWVKIIARPSASDNNADVKLELRRQ